MSINKFFKRGIRYILHGQPTINTTANITTLGPSHLLQGRVALVTGGTSGIGYEIAKAYIHAGAKVVITGRNTDRVNATVKELAKTLQTSEIAGIEMDLRNVSSLEQQFKKATERFGRIDCLVNNGGIIGGVISKCTEEEFSDVINTNLKGVFFLSRIVGRYFIQNDIHGNILNIASSSSLRPATSAYTLSKWGLRGLTLGLARMLAPHNIVVNGVAPGPTATPMLMRSGVRENISFPKSLTGRYATAEEIANMAVILVSDMSRMIIGDIVYMTGGAGILTNEDMNYNFT